MYVGDTDAFLKAHVADSAVVFAIEVSTEELLKNIISYGYVKYGKRRYIDYRLSIMPDQVCVVISDDARAFNPIGHSSKTGYGLQLLHGLCKKNEVRLSLPSEHRKDGVCIRNER